MKAKNREKRKSQPQHKADSYVPVAESSGTPPKSVLRGKPPAQNATASVQPAIRIVMMPRDVNPLGTIFGGLILSSIDLAGVVEAHRHSDRMLVTAAMHEVKFIAPVFVGDLVSFYTETARIGRTSITIRVTVEAARATAPHAIVRVTQAEVVYVAIDEAGKPVPVRPDRGLSKRPCNSPAQE
jgi:acyl-CoA thioesterase YciA